MGWANRLSKYEGSAINIWIEDRSGEDQTKPKAYTLYKVEETAEQQGQQELKVYISETQFLSVPLFADERFTRLEQGSSGEVFVSEDVERLLLYWIYFE